MLSTKKLKNHKDNINIIYNSKTGLELSKMTNYLKKEIEFYSKTKI